MYDPSNPYPAPMQGYSWAGQPPQSLNPFAAAGTSMVQDYAMMRQNQDVQQYQQMIQPPQFMSVHQQAAVAYQPQYNFGVVGGQQQMYDEVQRRSGLGGTAFALSAGMVGATWPLWDVGNKMATGLLQRTFPKMMATRGIGTVAGMTAGFAASALITYPFTALAERGIERARFAADIQGDIQDYSSRWTGGTGFGRAATRGLSQDLMESMNEPGQFFRGTDQLKIHKMGLASGMLKGRDVGEYRKNFEDLKNNAQDIIKLLNTTVEGGMSVMQELNKAGITTSSAMRQQVMQAKSIGVASGLGTQNVLALGAAGAQAAAGTGWSATSMSNAYQANAAIVSNMAQNSPYMAQAVMGLGGVANAAASMANAQSNLFRSGMGIQSMAAIMNPATRGIDAAAFEKFATGDMGVLGIAQRAGAYGMNIQNRVLFEKYAMMNMNKMSEEQKALFYKGIYKGYASTRGGPSEGAAWEFAGQFTTNINERQIFSEMISKPINFAGVRAAQNMTDYQMRMSDIRPYTPIPNLFRSMGRGAMGGINALADLMYSGASAAVRGGAGAINDALSVMGRMGPFDMHRGVPSEMASQKMYGYNSINQSDLDFYKSYKTRQASGVVSQFRPKWSTPGLLGAMGEIDAGLKNLSATDRQQVFDVFSKATAFGENLQDSAWLSNKLMLSRQTMKMLADVNTRKTMLFGMNQKQSAVNSQIENAQISRESWSKGGVEESYYNAKMSEVSNLAPSIGAEAAINSAFARGGSGYSGTARSLIERQFGVKSSIKLSGVDTSVLDASGYERAMNTIGNAGVVRGKSNSQVALGATMMFGGIAVAAGTAWSGIGIGIGAAMFAGGVATLRMKNQTGGFFKGVGGDQQLNFMSQFSTGTVAQQQSLFTNLLEKGQLAPGTKFDDVIGFATANKGIIASAVDYRGAQTEKSLAQNIEVLQGSTKMSAKEKEAAMRIGGGLYSSIAGDVKAQQKSDVDILKKSEWGRSVGFDKSTTADDARGLILNAATTQAMSDIDQKLRAELMAAKSDIIKETGSGAISKDNKIKLLELNKQLKDMEQSTAAGVMNQQQQTAAPNILNYWNCQWMVR